MRLPRPTRPRRWSGATLADFAERAAWPGEPPTRFFCDQVASTLRDFPRGRIAVVGGTAVRVWVEVIRSCLPALEVHEVPDTVGEEEAFLDLVAAAPLDAIIDSSDVASQQRALFSRTFRHLAPGGVYLARLVAGEDDLWSLLAAAQAERVAGFPRGDRTDLAWLVRCLESIEIRARVVRVVPRRPGRAKLSEEQVDALLARRPDLGAVVDGVPAETLVSRCQYDDNGPGRGPSMPEEFRAPAMRLRRYTAATATPKQVVTAETVVFPDTFRYNTMPRLTNIYLDDYAPRFADPHMPMSWRTDLPGAWFHLDSEAPGAYGHFVTEQLPRLWALEAARRAESGLRVLLSLTKDRNGKLAPFELDVLAAVGIEESDVHVIDRPVRVERLYAATPMYSYPDRGPDEGGVPYIHPGVREVWQHIGDHLEGRAEVRKRPARLFCTRRAGGRRTCRNSDEVEALFASHGFTVIRPEESSMAEQVALFRAAEVVAGYAGSAMFTLAMCPEPKRVIALAPDAYTGRNEYGIASVWGHRLTTVWSRSEIDHPPGGWTREAFWAPFTFDFHEEGRFLEAVLARLG